MTPPKELDRSHYRGSAVSLPVAKSSFAPLVDVDDDPTQAPFPAMKTVLSSRRRPLDAGLDRRFRVVRGGADACDPDTDVLSIVAQALTISRHGAEVALLGPLSLARRCARVIDALRAVGADEALVQFIQPIDVAIYTACPAIVGEGESRGSRATHGDEREVHQAYLDNLYRTLDLPATSRTTGNDVQLELDVPEPAPAAT
jgi:hypothetical protein